MDYLQPFISGAGNRLTSVSASKLERIAVESEDIEAKLDALAESVRRMQAFAQASNLLLAEVVNNLAKLRC